MPVIAEIELASRWLQGRVIAITGTKGKSTTTALTGRMLEAAGFKVTVGGNIGAPLSAQVGESTPDTFHVVEASSFQLEQIDTFHPWIAVMLNFSPDHLDRHPERRGVRRGEGADLREPGRRGLRRDQRRRSGGPRAGAARTGDEAAVRAQRRDRARHGRRRRVDRGSDRRRGAPRWCRSTPFICLGPHLVNDVMAAATVGAIAGAASPAMTAAVDGFRGLEHAMELVADFDGVRFVNDSKATNVESALRSIESFERDLVAIIGGKFKGGDLRLLRDPLKARAKAVVAIGEARPLVREALADLIAVHEADTLSDAVARAYALAKPSGVVLLAPACASFDMFRDYAERGRRFKEEVKRLIEMAND